VLTPVATYGAWLIPTASGGKCLVKWKVVCSRINHLDLRIANLQAHGTTFHMRKLWQSCVGAASSISLTRTNEGGIKGDNTQFFPAHERRHGRSKHPNLLPLYNGYMVNSGTR
jgi:hypothetical protein